MARKKRNVPQNKTTRAQRTANTGKATSGIYTVTKMVDLLKPWELSPSNRFETYQQMLKDDAVWSSIEARITSVEVAQSRPNLKFDRHSERSVWLKDFLEHGIHGMNGTTRQFGRDAAEMIYNGVAPFEVNTKTEPSDSPYAGMFTLDTLTYIDPLTLDPINTIVTQDGGRSVKYWRQLTSAFNDKSGFLSVLKTSTAGAVDIDARKVAVASYAASSSRPLGTSPLDAAYVSWREKVLLQEYLLMGVQKDLAGTPVLRVPQNLLEEADQDPNSLAAKTVQQLTTHMNNLHAGDQTYVILPSNTLSDTGTGNQAYDMQFKGVDGGGKNFDLVQIIEQKKKAIYNTLGAPDLITGESGGGSFNMLEGKTSMRVFQSQRDNIIVDEMWNNTIIPLILKLNGFTKEKISDIPKYVHGQIQPVSLGEVGQYYNRVGRFLPATPDVMNAIMRGDMDIDYTVPENYTPDQCREITFTYEEPQKNGTGEGSSGSGDSQAGGGGSDTNVNNAD